MGTGYTCYLRKFRSNIHFPCKGIYLNFNCHARMVFSACCILNVHNSYTMVLKQRNGNNLSLIKGIHKSAFTFIAHNCLLHVMKKLRLWKELIKDLHGIILQNPVTQVVILRPNFGIIVPLSQYKTIIILMNM
jgi:hypothetical protein